MIFERTKKLSLDVLKFTDELPKKRSLSILINQLTRSSTSIGANYRSACMGKSYADFIAKLCIALEEADETIYWLELIKDYCVKNNDDTVKMLLR
ncbi:MAG: four helix bundle protein [Planctomycetes bacterium]|nr:four helix bundle protein [Planctomycetota bacterium]